MDSKMLRSVFVGSEIGLGAGGKTPVGEWLLLPFGDIAVERPVAGGPFRFTREAADTLVAWFARMGRALAIDYEHQTFDDFNTRPDGLRPAAGWIHGLEARRDGLWVTGVKWAEKAAALLASGEYKYFSPVIFWQDKDYTVPTALGPVALTNDPAMLGTPALAAKQENEKRCDASTGRSRRLVAQQHTEVHGMNENAQAILQILGLDPENVTTEAIDAALSEERIATLAALLELGEGASKADVLAVIGAALGLVQAGAPEPEVTPDEAVAAMSKCIRHCVALGRRQVLLEVSNRLELRVSKHVDAAALKAQFVALAKNKIANPIGHVTSEVNNKVTEQCTALQKQVADLQAKDVEREFDALVLSTEHAGKIAPATRDKYLSMFKSQGKEDFEALVLNAMAPKVSDRTVFAGGAGGKPAKPDGKHAYEQKIDEIVAKEKVTKLVAMRRAQSEHPQLFAAYRKERRVSDKDD